MIGNMQGNGLMDRQRRIFLVAVFIIFTAAILLDRLVFGRFIFEIKNTSGWDSYRWYNFEYQLQKIEKGAPADDTRKLLLVIGSSIAQYSVQKDMLERDLYKLSGESYRVEILSHAAMLPTDMKHYAGRIRAVHPDRILYLTNPADIDLERFIPPWEFGENYQVNSHRDYLEIRYPMKIFYPGRHALETLDMRSFENTLALLGRSLFYSIRFRKDWFEPVKFSLLPPDQPRKSYLYYQGIPLKEGIFREGLTGKCFSFDLGRDTLYAEFRKKLMNQHFRVRFYARKKSDRILPGRYETDISYKYKSACRIDPEYRFLFDFKPDRDGWKNIPLKKIGDDEEYFAVLSHVEEISGETVQGGLASFRGKGLRLPGNFGLKKNVENDIFFRRRGLEDVRISSLNDDEYIDDFYRRIQPQDWRKPENSAMHQLNTLRLGKFYTDWIEFEEIYQLKELGVFLQILEDVPVIIVNNPENPITADEYMGNSWYRGYLKYYKTLQSRYKNVHFYDISREKKLQHFIDSHHLTYDGMVELSPEYARIILDTF